MLPAQPTEVQLIFKLLSYVRTHWWVFFLEFLCIWGLSFQRYTQTPPVYESHGSLLIDSSRRQLYQSVLYPGYPGGNDNARKRNIAQLLMSQEMAERFKNQMAENYDAEGRPIYLRSFFSEDGSFQMRDLRDFLALSWDKASDAYNLRCQASNPEAAQALCQALLTSIEGYYPEVGEREALLKRDFLSRQISSLTQQIYERERSLSSLQKKSADFLTFMLSDPDDRGFQRLKQEETKLKHQLATNRAIRKLLLDAPQSKHGEAVTLEPAIRAVTERLSELQYQLQLTENTHDLDRDERITSLHSEIESLSRQLAQLSDREQEAVAKAPLPTTDVHKKLSELEYEYRSDLIRLEDTQREISELMLKQSKYGEEKLEYERLQAELDQRKKLLSNLFQKQQETELELSTGKAEIFTLQQPTRESQRIEPQFAKFFYGSLSITLFLFGLTAILLLVISPRLDSEEEVNRLNLPVLGKVPLVRRSPPAEELSTFGMEYLKIMNYRILRETKDTRCPVIIVSSAHAREGKSTISRMLTLASHTPGKKSLLIDGDLLTAHPNSFFGVKEDFTPGLRALLTGEFRGPISKLLVGTPYEGLSVMPRGGRIELNERPDSLESLKGPLEELRSLFDVIYIDTPPLFAANLAHQWAGISDLVVLVARLFVTRPKHLTEAIQTCKIFTRSPVGVALNCVPLTGPDKRVSNYYFSRRKPRPTASAA